MLRHIIGLFFLLTIITSVANAAPIKLTIDAMAEPGSSKQIVIHYLVKLLEQRSSGRIHAAPRLPTRQTRSSAQVIRDLLDQKIQIAIPSTTSLAYLDPYLKIFEYPFLYRDQEHRYQVLDYAIGQELLTAEFRKRFKILSIWEHGDNHLVELKQNSLPAQRPNLESKDLSEGFPVEELINIHSICTTPMSTQQTSRWTEATLSDISKLSQRTDRTTVTLTRHSTSNSILLVDSTFWLELPGDLRIIISDAVKDATAYTRELAQQAELNALRQLRANDDVQIVPLDYTERCQWRQKTLNIYSQICNSSEIQLIDRISNYHPNN